MKVIGTFKNDDGKTTSKEFSSFTEYAAYVEKHFGEFTSCEGRREDEKEREDGAP